MYELTQLLADEVQMERRTGLARRSDDDRRQDDVPVEVEQRTDDRRKSQRRRHIDPTTCERDYSMDEIEFMRALDTYKQSSGRMFPTCSEVLEVLRGLGYVRLTEDGLPVPAEISSVSATTDDAEDWEDDSAI